MVWWVVTPLPTYSLLSSWGVECRAGLTFLLSIIRLTQLMDHPCGAHYHLVRGPIPDVARFEVPKSAYFQ